MAKLCDFYKVFITIQIQAIFSSINNESLSSNLLEHSEIIEAGLGNQEGEESVAYSQHLIKHANRRKIRSTSNDSYYGLQYEQICRASGSQPCTCYYPDHTDVVQFQLGIDEITTNAIKANGTGPSSCEDLNKLGHFLNGYYMIRSNTTRVKATYCVFNQSSETFFKISIKNSIYPIKTNKYGSKVIRFCGGVKGKPCRFYFSDNPDSPQHGFELTHNKHIKKELILNATRKPASCKDLQLLGHFLNGFYILHFNTVKVRIVYCDFKSLETDRSELNLKNEFEISSNSSKSCSDIGSQPCSCYKSNHPNILQFELGSDEITRSATNENSTAPANCQDLKNIGYTLNGFYMLRGANSRIIKIVFCELNRKEATPIDKTTSKANFIIQSLKEKDVTKDYFTNTKAPNYTQFGSSLLLINKHGKCLAVNTKGDEHPSKNGARIIQAECNPSEKGQLWKRNQDRICNDWDKCISTPLQKKPGSATSIIIHWESNHKDQRQQFRMSNDNNMINLGKCLGIRDDADYPQAEAKTSICNENENGQIWNFVNIDEYQRNTNKNYKTQTNYPKSELVKNHSKSIILQTTSHRINQQQSQITVTQPNYLAENTEVAYIKSTTLKPNNLVFGAISPTKEDYFSSARRFDLTANFKSLLVMNNHGKCLAVNTKGVISPSENGARIIQSECNLAEKGQLWQLKENRLCNDWNKCISTPLEEKCGFK